MIHLRNVYKLKYIFTKNEDKTPLPLYGLAIQLTLRLASIAQGIPHDDGMIVVNHV